MIQNQEAQVLNGPESMWTNPDLGYLPTPPLLKLLAALLIFSVDLVLILISAAIALT